jgi:hypothetical protein
MSSPNLRVGQMVLIQSDDRPQDQWRLGMEESGGSKQVGKGKEEKKEEKAKKEREERQTARATKETAGKSSGDNNEIKSDGVVRSCNETRSHNCKGGHHRVQEDGRRGSAEDHRSRAWTDNCGKEQRPSSALSTM